MSKEESNTLEIRNRRIIFNGIVYTVLERYNELNKKPSYFLFDTKNRVFLSSLYPVKDNTYHFDVRGDGHYLLRFSQNGYEIQEFDKKNSKEI